MLNRFLNWRKIQLHLPGDKVGRCKRAAAIWDVNHFGTGDHLEQFAGQMGHVPIPSRGHIDLVWIGFGMGDEFRNGCGRNRWMDHHHQGRAGNARDRHDVAREIEGKIAVERRIDRIRGADDKERVSVGGRIDDALSADITVGAGPVIDEEGLSQPFREPLTYNTRADVLGAASGKTDDDAHRPRRKGLRPCDMRDSRERGGPCCQMQKSTARKFHSVPS